MSEQSRLYDIISEKDAEIQRLKVSLNQQIQAWQFEYGKAKQYEEQIQHLKSSRVKDIEDAIREFIKFVGKKQLYVDEEGIWKDAFANGTNVTEETLSEYLKPFYR